MRVADPEILEGIGLGLYERKALMALMLCGVADAATLCREGDVPSSKIYQAMEKLAGLGLVQIQQTRPRMFAALPADAVVARVVEIAREQAERFAAHAPALQAAFAGLKARVRAHQPFLDLAWGVDGHVRRHLAAADRGPHAHPVLPRGRRPCRHRRGGRRRLPDSRRIARNAAEHGVEHRVVFGFTYRTAGALVAFLRAHRHDLRQVTGVRYSGELGHPFHVVDEDTVVLPLDHPFVKEGRFASLLVRDRELADSLAGGFHELWRKAMRSLREVSADPRGTG